MTEARRQWHVDHLASLNELLSEYILAHPGKMPQTTTGRELVAWAFTRTQEPVNEPAVCSHCGEPCSDSHACQNPSF